MAYKIPYMPDSYQSFSHYQADEVSLSIDISVASRLRLTLCDNEGESITVCVTPHEAQELMWQLENARDTARGL